MDQYAAIIYEGDTQRLLTLIKGVTLTQLADASFCPKDGQMRLVMPLADYEALTSIDIAALIPLYG